MQPILPVAVYRLKFAAPQGVQLPVYAGSAWRGVFGHALKRLVCVTRETTCPDCLLYRSCVYPYLFETPPDPNVGKLSKYTAAPHPFVIRPVSGGTVAAGETVTVDVVLFGHGNRHLPYVLHAFTQAGQRGIGMDNRRLDLMQVSQQTLSGDWQTIYCPDESLKPLAPFISDIPPCPSRLTLYLKTPLRLRQAEKLVRANAFQFGTLFSNLLRRISLLSAFHTDTPLETDFAALSRAGWAIKLQSANLHWHEWNRFSSRQNTRVQMGGLLGSIELDGAELEPFWSYLWLGQWTHAGKGAVMGLGAYQLSWE